MKKNWPSTVCALLALGAIGWVRCHPAAADAYALRFYPKWSAGVSAVSALVPVSLEEILVGAAVILLIVWLFQFRKRWLSIINLVLWLAVWFYAGWGLNYFRSNIYERAQQAPAQYDETRFRNFLRDYTEALNAGCVPVETVDKVRLTADVRTFYASLPEKWGLARPRTWQEPKRLLFNRLYSSVGVSGFVGPFFNEIQVNGDALPVDYPLSYAHEYAHLLGVSNEGEAQFWGYKACLASSDPVVRHSGRMGIFPYVAADARRFLGEQEYREWIAGLRPEVIGLYEEHRAHWDALYSPAIGRIQEWIYDLYLKGNDIPSGTASYGEVVRLLISLDAS